MFNLKIIFLIFIINFIKDGFCQNRIVGGSDTNIENFPYQVSLQVKVDDINSFLKIIYKIFNRKIPFKWAHNCGGSIISRKVVLTATHCILGYSDLSSLSICAGSSDSENCQNGQRYDIKEIITYDNYIELYQNDISLLIMSNCFRFGRTINEIKYNDCKYVVGGEELLLSGWGKTSSISLASKQLQEIQLTAISNANCNKSFNGSETVLCTLVAAGFGACQGDSGGPLVTLDQSCVVGIVSFGTVDCAIGIPDAFTRVSVFVDWISNKTVNINAECNI